MVVKTSGSEAGWKRILLESCRDIRDLRGFLNLSEEEVGKLSAVQETFPFFANPYYLSLIRADDPDDPIRRMCVPSMEELDLSGLADTSGESTSTVLPGLQHKYAETALVLSTNRCAVYCRHCFRRRFVGLSANETVRDVDAVASYVNAHAEITNVLISGGDALMSDKRTIRRLLEAFSEIDHVRTIRLGTRVPVVLPQRITGDSELLGILKEVGSRKQLHVVTQFNHPFEVTPESHAAAKALLRAGVPVRNQTVLLRGVNDDPEILARLMDDLVGIGVAPYYVFQCRPTTGVKNRFQVPLLRACMVVEQAQGRLSGLAKSFRFIVSHDMGKIEVLGLSEGRAAGTGKPFEPQPIILKFHQARNQEFLGRPFCVVVGPDDCWFSEPHLRLAFARQNGLDRHAR